MGYDFGDGALARRAAWMVERYARDDLTVDDAAAHFSDEMTVDEWVGMFRAMRRPIDEVVAYEELSPVRAFVSVRSEGRPMTLRLIVSDDADAHIRGGTLMLDPAPGVTVREATADDGPALADLERRCPVVDGDTEVTYDRGDDYFAQHRLMGTTLTSVAEYEGRVVGSFADALRPLRVGGRMITATYRFHLRVDPACRGMSIMPALNASQGMRLYELSERRPVVTSYVAASNQTVIEHMGPEQASMIWSQQIERLVVDCAAHAGPPAGRPAAPADAERVAALLDASHGREELAPAFDAAHVTDRLTRSRLDYSWIDVLLGERAVVGVWDQRLGMTKRRGGIEERTVRATALDWGCEPGAEDELLALFRAWCGRLAMTGSTHLVLFSSAPSPGRASLDALRPTVEPFWIGVRTAEPPGVGERGVYVDPIFF